MKFFIADAFTDKIFGGNPAGVVVLPDGADFPSDETMVKTAAELRYSETAFIKILGDNEFNIRYFTPAAEVDLCGHATIASFYCLKHAGLLDTAKPALNHTLAGDLNITVDGDSVLMDMASPQLIRAIEDEPGLDELYRVCGAKRCRTLLPLIISTGLPDIMLPLQTREDLEEMAPDMEALTELSRKYNVVGVHAFTLEGDDATAHCRNFAPLYDIDEEAATGTSNGALTYYLYLKKILYKGQSRIIQGEAMGRPSEIITELNFDLGGVPKIKVGGKAAILTEGEINI